jgi:hypothetical protein
LPGNLEHLSCALIYDVLSAFFVSAYFLFECIDRVTTGILPTKRQVTRDQSSLSQLPQPLSKWRWRELGPEKALGACRNTGPDERSGGDSKGLRK